MRGKGSIKDIKRQTWCTYQNFSNIYDSVYETMCLAKVAIKLDDEVMYDFDGNVVDYPEICFGHPTKFKVIRPAQIVFVDETGCNTSQKEDGNVGGQQFILPSECAGSGGLTGTVTDIHFTLLCFTSGLGLPIMCAVILKSEKPVGKIPYSWRFGIDITKDFQTNGTSTEVFSFNSGVGSAMCGGPTCSYKGKEILALFVLLRKQVLQVSS
jgi:hypothetical protein